MIAWIRILAEKMLRDAESESYLGGKIDRASDLPDMGMRDRRVS